MPSVRIPLKYRMKKCSDVDKAKPRAILFVRLQMGSQDRLEISHSFEHEEDVKQMRKTKIEDCLPHLLCCP